jgi:hypothetical protein
MPSWQETMKQRGKNHSGKKRKTATGCNGKYNILQRILEAKTTVLRETKPPLLSSAVATMVDSDDDNEENGVVKLL